MHDLSLSDIVSARPHRIHIRFCIPQAKSRKSKSVSSGSGSAEDSSPTTGDLELGGFRSQVTSMCETTASVGRMPTYLCTSGGGTSASSTCSLEVST